MGKFLVKVYDERHVEYTVVAPSVTRAREMVTGSSDADREFPRRLTGAKWYITDVILAAGKRSFPGLTVEETEEMEARPPRCGECSVCEIVEGLKDQYMPEPEWGPEDDEARDELVRCLNRVLYVNPCLGKEQDGLEEG